MRCTPTVEDSYRKTVSVETGGGSEARCCFDILDTAGKEEYVCLRSEYMAEGNAFLVLYSVTSTESFHAADGFLEELLSKTEARKPVTLIGNKIDLVDRVISTEEGEAKAEAW